MSKENGGPAFPMPIAGCADGSVYNTMEQSAGQLGGMSLRDYFAAKALAGLCVTGPHMINPEQWDAALLAKTAYVFADAMLRAREA